MGSPVDSKDTKRGSNKIHNLVDPRQPSGFELTIGLSRRLEEELEVQALRSIRRIRDYGWVGARPEDIGSEGNTPEYYRQQLKDHQDLYGQLYPSDGDGEADGSEDGGEEENEHEDEDEGEGDYDDECGDDSTCGDDWEYANSDRSCEWDFRAADGDGDGATVVAESEDEKEGESESESERSEDADIFDGETVHHAVNTTIPETDGNSRTNAFDAPLKSANPSPLGALGPNTSSLNIGYTPSHSDAASRRNEHGSAWFNTGRRRPYNTGLASLESIGESTETDDLKLRKRCAEEAEEGDENKRPR